MPTLSTSPFKLDDLFFINLEFIRKPSQPNNVQIKFQVQMKVLAKNEQGKLQVNFRILSEENPFYKVNVELVGLFDYLDPSAETDLEMITAFINNQVFLLAWTQCSSFIRMLSSSMGMAPIHLEVPEGFSISQEQLLTNLKNQRSSEDFSEETETLH